MIEGAFAQMGKGLSLMGFGFSNLGNSGIKSMMAIRDGAGQALLGLGALALMLGAIAAIAAIAIGVVAVRAAADFQQGLNRLVTGAGDVTDNMTKMGQAILGISVDTGIMTGPLLQAMYQIISANQRGAQAENTLAVAAKGAVIEQANVVDVAKALTTAMTDYGTKTYNATQFMNGYTRAVQLGKITLEELSTTMGPILPLAQNLGVHFADVAAAMATMTNAGIPAARAATSLRFLFQNLENPTKKESTAMAEMGLNSIALANEMKVSLPGALQMVYDAAKKAGPEGSVPFNRAVSDMIGGQRSLQAYLALTGTHMKTFASNTKAISDAMNASKTVLLGWTTAQSNFNVQMDRAKAAVQALLITIGSALLPILTAIVMKVVPLVVAFTQWVIQSHAVQNVMAAFGVILSTIGTIMGPVVAAFLWFMNILGRLITWVKNNELAMTAFKYVLVALGAIIAVGLTLALIAVVVILAVVAAAIAVVIAIIMLVITVVRNWGNIMTWFGNIFKAIGTTLHTVWNAIVTFIHTTLTSLATFFIGIWTGIKNFLTVVWNVIKMAAFIIFALIVAVIIQPFVPLINWFKAHWTQIQAILTSIWNAIKGVATSIWNAIASFFSTNVTNTQNTLSTVWNAIKGVLSTVWNAISTLATTIWNKLSTFIIGVVTGIRDKLAPIWNAIKTAFTNAMDALKGIAQGAWDGVLGVIKSAVNGIIGLIDGLIGGVNNITSIIGLPGIPLIPYLASGIENFGGGMAYVHGGEVLTYLPKGSSVVPANRVTLASAGTGMASGGGATVVNHHYYVTVNAPALSRREAQTLADEVSKELAAKYRLQTGRSSTGVY